jgi:hypothetical protein
MAHNGKTTRPIVRNAACLQAFARLDAALAKNARSNDVEKIQLLRLKVFGCVPATVEIQK